MLQDRHLTSLERTLCSAAAAGRLLDCRCRPSDEDDPARGPARGKDRQIRAQVLRQLLTGEGCLDQAFGRPLAVRLRGASVTGRLNLGGRTLRCPLELYGCYLGGRLDLAKAEASDISLRGSHLAQRLSARRLRLTGDLTLTGGFQCHGTVDLRYGHVGGVLGCDGATLSNPGGRALAAAGLTVDRNLSLRGAEVTGEMALLGARVGGQLFFFGATLSNPGGRALTAAGLTADGNLFLSGAEVTGEVALVGARVGGLSCDGATLSNPDGWALAGDGLTADGNLFLSGAKVTGEVRLLDARVGGGLFFLGATLSNPGGRALTGDRLTTDGDLSLHGAKVTGEVWLLSARVGGGLVCDSATLSNPIHLGPALNLQQASVTGAVSMHPAQLNGRIDLRAARVGVWSDDRGTWPAALSLEGFVYDAIDAPAVTPEQRLGWLRRQGGYLPQPYEQLASVYRRAGHERAALTVAIAKQQARRARARQWWVRAPSRAWSFVLRWTIGYGYRPALVLPYLAGLFVIGWVVFDHAYPTELRPAKSGSGQPGFNPARYTLDLLLPVASLRQREAFVPHGYAAWWAFGLTLAGWLLAAVVVAGLTGVFKRD